MISSMTGYGKGIVQQDDIIAEVEVKSLNSRFLDLSVKLPRSLGHKELAIRDVVKNNVKRGKVTLNIFLKKEGLDNRNMFIDKKALGETVKMLQEIKQVAGSDAEINFDHILSFQNIYFTDTTGDEKLEYSIVLEALNKAIAELNQMRINEGCELEKDLKLRIQNIADAVANVESQSTLAVKDYFQKLRDRAQNLFTELVENEDRLNMELALLAEKYDVTEEIVRLKSHIKVFLETLANSDEVGRRLNFLCQEMNREANTINSKSISSDISYQGLFIKEELEKIREQIQNIE